MIVDLDAARTARAEARGDHPAVLLGGREYKLVAELSIDGSLAYRENRVEDFVKLVLADPGEADDFLANRVSWFDLNGLLETWATSPGESPAS